MRIKIRYKTDVLRVKPPEIGTEISQFENMVRFILKTFPQLEDGFLLKYEDEDGDMVTILPWGESAPTEFEEALVVAQQQNLSTLKLFVQETDTIQYQQNFMIDSGTNLYNSLGKEKIKELSSVFYNKVFENINDDHYEHFGALFEKRSKSRAIQNLSNYLIERFGGPKMYSDKKGHPALKMRHAPYKIRTESAKRWLILMGQSADEVGIGMDNPDRRPLFEFFIHFASFLRNSGDDLVEGCGHGCGGGCGGGCSHHKKGGETEEKQPELDLTAVATAGGAKADAEPSVAVGDGGEW